MIDAEHGALSVAEQCELLELARSTYYYEPAYESAENLALMRRIDEQYLQTPFYGSRRMAEELSTEDCPVNRKRVQRLMRRMGIAALVPRKATSTPDVGHRVHPYLLRGLSIDRANQVWCSDITYVPMERGFMYLVAIMDWYSRYVLSWRLSNTLDAEFCVTALEEALGRGKPEIFNTDQGAQFTSREFTGVLQENQVAISMDGRGRALDNVFIERLWWSVKYEEVYLKAYGTVADLNEGLARYFDFYDHRRKHQALDYRTPYEVYQASLSHEAPRRK
ncbi:MAG: IS3 family transposase [Planctomycetes bacterium]|nr:IS3 family transposase [Planctomycetota bacterium]